MAEQSINQLVTLLKERVEADPDGAKQELHDILVQTAIHIDQANPDKNQVMAMKAMALALTDQTDYLDLDLPPYSAPADVMVLNNNFQKINDWAKLLSALQISYSNPDMPSVEDVKAAIDLLLLNNTQIANRVYPGVDLTIKFATEIAAAPYSGNVWAWIKARTQSQNFAGIYIGDYIPFSAGGNNIKAEVAGINTYMQYGNPSAVGNHIDFISRDCWPDTHVYNKVNYNNGTSVSPSPFLASDLYAFLNSLQMNVPNATTANPALVAVDYRTTGIYDKLPATLQAVIIPKRLYLPSRYTAGSLLTDDNSGAWNDAGKLWLPSEIEVYGTVQWGSRNGYSGCGFQQYPIFATNMKRAKGAGGGVDRSHWWLLSANSNNSTNCTLITSDGLALHNSASTTGIRVPVCFRIG